MSNRREFLQMSLAVSALPVLAADRLEDTSLHRNGNEGLLEAPDLIVEMTSPLAMSFREEAARLGFQPYSIHDDITDLWYHYLDLKWKQAPRTVVGLTLSTSLFCLETLARDYGMRVWFRAIHTGLGNGRVEHAVSGPDRMVEQAAAFDEDWPTAFARFAAALPPIDSSKSQKRIVGSAKTRSEEPGPMVSWIIAPRIKNQTGRIS